MIILKTYDPDKKEQKVWYESSMIKYSRMVEDPNYNKGNLYVVFNNGSQYMYKDVKFEDYTVFVAGGTDNSNGMALNKLIKPKYEFVKLEPADTNLLMEELTQLQTQEKEKKNRKNHTIFLSGHKNLNDEDFIIWYERELEDAVMDIENYFVVGDDDGFDIMAQNFLLDELNIDPDRLTLYYVGNEPKNANKRIKNKIGGYETEEERDYAMTMNSARDIAYIEDYHVLSSTAKNILRRHCAIVEL